MSTTRSRQAPGRRNGRYVVDPSDDAGREPLSPVVDALVEVDPTGRITAVDAVAEQLFGRSAQDLVGRSVSGLVADRKGDPGPRPPGVDLLLTACRRDGSTFPAQVRIGPATGDGPDGRVRLAVRALPQPEQPERPEEAGSGRESVAYPDAAGAGDGAQDESGPPPNANALAENARVVAHDLNNILSIVLIYSDLISRGAQGRSAQEYAAEIRAAAERGAELTGQLVHLARHASHDAVAVAPRPRLDEDLLLQAIRRRSSPSAPAPTPEAVTVVVVDDHRMFAEGLTHLLDVEDDIEVRGVGATGREAVELVERLRPRVLLVDFDLPEGNGLLAATEVKRRWPETMVVMVTGSTDDRLLLRAVEAGCSGYLTKDRAASDVADAVRTVAAGEPLISPTQMARILPQLSRSQGGTGPEVTEREREVLVLLSRGATNETIAAELSTTVDAVRADIEGACRALGAHSKLEAVASAIREGVIVYNSPF